MASSKKIRPEQLTRARKLLHDLPEKEDGKTRPEAAEFLESDFRKALDKGYSPKELSQILKNEGIIIPAYLIKRYFRETADAPRQKNLRRPRKKRLRQNNLLSCRIYRMRSYEHECVNFLCRRQ